jgi:RNA polymerase sigma-70 factor (ECF subfamily)
MPGWTAPMTDPDDRFRRLFRQNHRSLMVYAMRRTERRADAEDAVAEAFTVAWRRIEELPAGEHEQRLWLYGVARRTLANHRRADRRVERLRLRIARDPTQHLAPEDGARDEVDVELGMWALGQLAERDQELVRLALWEELSHADIAMVVGTSVPNVAVRLHRARKRLKRLFDAHLQGRPAAGQEPGTGAIGGQRGHETRG